MFIKHNSKQFGKQFYINPSNFAIELALKLAKRAGGTLFREKHYLCPLWKRNAM